MRNICKNLLAVISVLALSACAPRITSDEVSQIEDLKLCAAYHSPELTRKKRSSSYNPKRRRKKIRDEIKSRNLIKQKYWNEVDNHWVKVGMSRCAVLAAGGWPRRGGGDRYHRNLIEDWFLDDSDVYEYGELDQTTSSKLTSVYFDDNWTVTRIEGSPVL